MRRASMALAGLMCAGPVGVQAQIEEPPIRFGLRAPGTELAPGGVLPLVVVAHVPRGWHLYGLRQPADGPLPTRVEVGPAPLFSLASPVVSSQAEVAFDPNFGQVVEWHDDSATFRVPLRAAVTALPGSYRAEVRVSYQRCNDRLCLPLRTDTLPLALSIAGRPVSSEPVSPQATSPPPATPPAAASPATSPLSYAEPQREAPPDSPPPPRVDTLRTTSPVPAEVPSRPVEPVARRDVGPVAGALGVTVAALLAVWLRVRRRR